MCHIVFCGLPGSTVFFPRYLKKTRFKKKILNIKRVFWFSLQLLSETLLILRRCQRDTINKVSSSSRKLLVILVGFQCNFNFIGIFSKILKCQISLKSFHWGPSCFMRVNRRTDGHDEGNGRFLQFCKRSYKLQ